MIPEIPADSFAKRLYSTFLSYLPKEKAIFDLKMNVDQRGSFTELVHTLNCGQVSINISNLEVSGYKIEAVHVLPGYTHNIINLSDTEDLVTVMYCNEIFNPNKPDTYFDKVEK